MINKERLKIQNEVLDAFEKNRYKGFAIVPTGTGKALILIEILKRVKPKTVWYLCDSERNRDVTFRDELIKWGAEEWIDRIEFMCYQTAYKRSGEHIDLVLCDEADYAITPAYFKAITENHIKHPVLVSGTISKKKKDILKEANIPIIFEIEIDEVEKRKALNKANYFLVNFMLTPAENKKYLGFNYAFRKMLNTNYNKRSLEMLQITRKHFLSNLDSSANVCRKLLGHLYKEADNKVLIFCGLSEQADRICKHSYHSKTTDDAFIKFNKGDIRVLSVVAKADRGLNINGVNNIVFESPTRSSTKFFQRTGRGRRLNVNDTVEVYFLVPYYKDLRHKTRPTIILDWIYKSAAKLDNFKPKNFQF